jgi:hypothetical protein
MRSSWLCSRGIVARRPKSSASDKRRSLRYHRSHFTTSVTRGTQCALAAVRRRLGVRRVGPTRVSASPCSSLDYHIEVHGFLNSVPHALIRAEVEFRATARLIEVFHCEQPVAARQPRSWGASMAQTLSTCPAPTDVMPNGRPSGSAAEPPRPDQTRKR